jgi:hypothetical protein
VLAASINRAMITPKATANFYQITLRNNPENSHLHTCRRENLKHNNEHLHSSSAEIMNAWGLNAGSIFPCFHHPINDNFA